MIRNSRDWIDDFCFQQNRIIAWTDEWIIEEMDRLLYLFFYHFSMNSKRFRGPKLITNGSQAEIAGYLLLLLLTRAYTGCAYICWAWNQRHGQCRRGPHPHVRRLLVRRLLVEAEGYWWKLKMKHRLKRLHDLERRVSFADFVRMKFILLFSFSTNFGSDQLDNASLSFFLLIHFGP